jgi:membrane protein
LRGTDLAKKLGTSWRALCSDVHRIWEHSVEDNIFFLASGIAFGILLALVPFVFLVLTGTAMALDVSPDTSSAVLRRLVDTLLPAHAEGNASPVHAFVDQILDSHRAVGVWSAVLFLWFSTRLFGALRSALARVLAVPEARGIVHGKLFDTVLVLLSTLLVTAYIALNTYLAAATSRGATLLLQLGVPPGLMSEAAYLGGQLLSLALVVGVFFLLYRFIPARRIHSRAALCGAFVAGVLFELARHLYEWITARFGPGSVYSGTLYAVMSAALWLYYSATIFLVGGEVARVGELRTRGATA